LRLYGGDCRATHKDDPGGEENHGEDKNVVDELVCQLPKIDRERGYVHRGSKYG
jgi:hypothetical protein